MYMARRPIGIEAAPTRAALESLAIQLSHVLAPETLDEILLLTVREALKEFENPPDVANATGKQYRSPADAYKLKLLFRRLVEKLVATQEFPPSGDLCEAIELPISVVEQLQSEAKAAKNARTAEVTAAVPIPAPVPVEESRTEELENESSEHSESGPSDISLEDDDIFAGYRDQKEYTYEDLKSVFAFQDGVKTHFGAIRMDLEGHGPCLILGYVFTKDMILRRPLAITILTPDGKLIYEDKMFNHVDSIFKTIRHEHNGKVYLIKVIPYFVGSKGRCWLNKKGNRDDPASKVYFILEATGIRWVDSEVYYALELKGTDKAAE